VVSLGFDASADEPLGFLRVTEDAFARAGALVAGAGLPAALVQEGGTTSTSSAVCSCASLADCRGPEEPVEFGTKSPTLDSVSSIARISTFAFSGIEAVPVEVQVQLAPGLPAFLMVGLADKAVGESRERVRAALTAIGLSLPPSG
jgi:hypothetical protein